MAINTVDCIPAPLFWRYNPLWVLFDEKKVYK